MLTCQALTCRVLTSIIVLVFHFGVGRLTRRLTFGSLHKWHTISVAWSVRTPMSNWRSSHLLIWPTSFTASMSVV